MLIAFHCIVVPRGRTFLRGRAAYPRRDKDGFA